MIATASTLLSSQRLCPRSWRISVAFTVVHPRSRPAVAASAPRLSRLSLGGGGHAIARDLHHLVRGKAELGGELLQGRRGTEGVHPDDGAAVTDVAVPAQGRGLLDRHASLH